MSPIKCVSPSRRYTSVCLGQHGSPVSFDFNLHNSRANGKAPTVTGRYLLCFLPSANRGTRWHLSMVVLVWAARPVGLEILKEAVGQGDLNHTGFLPGFYILDPFFLQKVGCQVQEVSVRQQSVFVPPTAATCFPSRQRQESCHRGLWPDWPTCLFFLCCQYLTR